MKQDIQLGTTVVEKIKEKKTKSRVWDAEKKQHVKKEINIWEKNRCNGKVSSRGGHVGGGLRMGKLNWKEGSKKVFGIQIP